MATYKELIAQIAELTKQAEAVRLLELADARRRIQVLMTENGLTAQDVLSGAKGFKATRSSKEPGKVKEAIPPLYRDQSTGATWSGRGRAPSWISGVDRDKFRIEQSTH
jgi:DNA-binding protein H-NS